MSEENLGAMSRPSNLLPPGTAEERWTSLERALAWTLKFLEVDERIVIQETGRAATSGWSGAAGWASWSRRYHALLIQYVHRSVELAIAKRECESARSEYPSPVFNVRLVDEGGAGRSRGTPVETDAVGAPGDGADEPA